MNELPESRERFAAAGIPLYGLDDMWRGRRWLGELCVSADGTVEHASLGHGDPPSRRPDDPLPRRFVTVVTVTRRARRASGDGGFLDATSRESAACVAGVALIADCWPWHLDRDVRQDWLRQQTDMAWELAQHLDDGSWAPLCLPVDGESATMRFRESEYGWVIAGEAPGVFLGVYGRGVTPYGLGLVRLAGLDSYEEVTEAASRPTMNDVPTIRVP